MTAIGGGSPSRVGKDKVVNILNRKTVSSTAPVQSF